MIPMGPTAVGVETEAELRSAVGVSIYDEVHLVNDIVMTDGITIDNNKTSLIIDGEYPRESGIFHQLTDVDNTDVYDTIGIGAGSSITLTFRNMVINGRNYYGVPYIVPNVPPFIYTDNVTVIYENVRYTGPQITYNHNGRTRYLNCDITITQTGTTPPEEVGEVNRVEIGGRTTITHTGTEDAVFWFNNTTTTSSLTILAGAEVTITSQSSYFMYNYDGLSPLPVTYTLQAGASLSLQMARGISLGQNHPVSAFQVNAGASFRYVQTGSNGTAASLYLSGALTVGQGARFYMQAASGTQPLIRYTSGTGRSLTVNNPLSFVLYSPNAAALNTLGTTNFSLHGGQVNTWSAAITPVNAAGGFTDLPEFRWFKLGYALPVELDGSFTGTLTTTTGNMTVEDEPHPLDTDLHLHSARVLSVGDWPVAVNRVVDDGRPVSGSTEPGANLIVEYEIEGSGHEIPGAADGDGSFSIETSGEEPPNIPADTRVTVASNIPFLIKRVTVTAIEVGALWIESAPVEIEFVPRPIALGPPLLPRDVPTVPVVVKDTRADIGEWELLASISGPLQAQSGEILPEALVFVETEGAAPVTLTGTPYRVYTGGPEIETSEVFWTERAGILVRVTAPIRSGVRYVTQILWTLRGL